MRAVVLTGDLTLYALVHSGLVGKGWEVFWKSGEGRILADLAHLEEGEVLLSVYGGSAAVPKGIVLLWRTPLGLRAYDPLLQVFLTRKDDPRSLAEGLQGRWGLGLLPGEQQVLWALGQGVASRGSALARELGIPLHRARFFLRSLRNKFGLPEEELFRLARHQVQVVALQGYPKPLAGVQAEPFLHVPG